MIGPLLLCGYTVFLFLIYGIIFDYIIIRFQNYPNLAWILCIITGMIMLIPHFWYVLAVL